MSHSSATSHDLSVHSVHSGRLSSGVAAADYACVLVCGTSRRADGQPSASQPARTGTSVMAKHHSQWGRSGPRQAPGQPAPCSMHGHAAGTLQEERLRRSRSARRACLHICRAQSAPVGFALAVHPGAWCGLHNAFNRLGSGRGESRVQRSMNPRAHWGLAQQQVVGKGEGERGGVLGRVCGASRLSCECRLRFRVVEVRRTCTAGHVVVYACVCMYALREQRDSRTGLASLPLQPRPYDDKC
jgi:hypothetical protein